LDIDAKGEENDITGLSEALFPLNAMAVSR